MLRFSGSFRLNKNKEKKYVETNKAEQYRGIRQWARSPGFSPSRVIPKT